MRLESVTAFLFSFIFYVAAAVITSGNIAEVPELDRQFYLSIWFEKKKQKTKNVMHLFLSTAGLLDPPPPPPVPADGGCCGCDSGPPHDPPIDIRGDVDIDDLMSSNICP
jgi:hypothetical protein